MSSPFVDPAEVLEELKDFQCATVEYVFRRMYVDEDATDRFLVADEVGLGKTLVARGVIAKALEHLRKEGERIDVLYICSNADIARQNIAKLNLTGDEGFALSSRITLLPIMVKDLRKDLNFISFTPKTSFDLVSAQGKKPERMLLYWLLREIWPLRGTGPKNVLQDGVWYRDRWRAELRAFRSEYEPAPTLVAEFSRVLEKRVREDEEAGRTNIRDRFLDLCDEVKRYRQWPDVEHRRARRAIIGDLRSLLAMACLGALKPKLIILDEFQRFKHLLGNSESHNELARNLFEQPGAKILLLSATPYKMYTLDHESDEDHYEDFKQTLDFLENRKGEADGPDWDLSMHRREILRLGSAGSKESLRASTRRLEHRLRKVMVRTEKLAASEDRNGMLERVGSEGKARLEPGDLRAYVALRAFSNVSGQGDPIEYWKSAPYLMNFMERYDLKRAFERTLKESRRSQEVTNSLKNLAREDTLPWSKIRDYGAVDPGNARLRALLADTTDAGVWRMVWVAPSMPYYLLEGPYSEPPMERFTKRLVFSSWKVVPRVVAAMTSYEAERRMARAFDKSLKNTVTERNNRGGLLSVSLQRDRDTGKERLTGMQVLGLMYPCITLAEECDPLPGARERAGASLPTLEEALRRAERIIEPLLEEIGAYDAKGPEDASWYWAAPILMDRLRYPQASEEWLSRPDLSTTWSGGGAEHGGKQVRHWPNHVRRAAALSGASDLGRPRQDLRRVLAQMALAGPGVVALRALWRSSGWSQDGYGEARDAAARLAWRLRLMFDLPEVALALRGQEEGEGFWRQVLAYCTEGGLQSVLDEYAHMLRDSEKLARLTPAEIASGVSEKMCRALGVTVSSMKVDKVPKRTMKAQEIPKASMRGHFALRFAEERSEDGTEPVTRASQVQEAFNSPFRPFVLATTSVGQEGLDFHAYCHAVVHWNLPANPVDLEQREGRVHRYKGHAVRKNLARDYGALAMAKGTLDPWERIFEIGKKHRKAGETDLIPFWIYSPNGGAKIERHVPALPLSRDAERLEALRRSLAVYRMVFGQARQEDLVKYLLSRFDKDTVSELVQTLSVDLQPPPLEGDLAEGECGGSAG